jgi:alpha-1,6-mannosyltransferase
MLLAPPAPGRTFVYLALFSAVFIAYLSAVRLVLTPAEPDGRTRPADSRPPVDAGLLLLGLAILFRLTFLAAPPRLSGDIERYLWDGRITLAGGNPYLETPATSGFAVLSGAPDVARIEHANVPTIYPPGAQALFAAGAAIGPGLYGIKILLVAADLLVIATLRSLLRARGLSPSRALIYAWNPLAITETAWSGHLESAAILCVLLAAGAVVRKKDVRATVALSAGALVKIAPIIFIAPLLRSIRARALLLMPLIVAAAYVPFRAAGWRVFDGLRAYADRWRANESLFAIVDTAIVWIDPTPALKAGIAWVRGAIPHTAALDLLYWHVYPVELAKIACGLALAGFAAALWRRRVEPLRGLYLLTCALLLLSPTAHPWYFLWLLPWLCFFPSRACILLTGLVSLAYVNLGASGRETEPYSWIRWVEYGPFLALLCADWLRGRARAPLAAAAVVRPGSG